MLNSEQTSKGINILGSTYSALSDYSQAGRNIRQLKAAAENKRAFGALEAERVRKDAARTLSTAQAELAASGLDVSGANSQAIQDTIRYNGEMSAYERIFTSNNEALALEQQAKNAKRAQKAAMYQSVLSIGSSIYGAMPT